MDDTSAQTYGSFASWIQSTDDNSKIYVLVHASTRNLVKINTTTDTSGNAIVSTWEDTGIPYNYTTVSRAIAGANNTEVAEMDLKPVIANTAIAGAKFFLVED